MLRGINLGAHKRISMKQLEALIAGLGYTDVTTYLQSGNVVFTATGSAAIAGTTIERAIVGELGHDVAVVVRTAAQHGFILPERGYPIHTPTSVAGGAETALVLGITREESCFDPKARSGAGAPRR